MRSATLALFLPLLLFAAPVEAEAPRVLASIKPVQSLVAAVMEGAGVPELLVPGNASPHGYSLRPSDAKRLAAAEIVFWIGPAYEGFLEKPLAALAGGAKVVTLAEAEGVEVLPAREGGVWAADHEAHGHGSALEADGHLWLDPENAKAIALAAARALAEADPAGAARYRANAARTVEALDRLDTRLRAVLSPVANVPYIVFHDAYQYLERRYGLAAAGAVAVTPERQPGARRVREIRERIMAAGAVCVFAEPQFEPALVRSLVRDSGARTGVLDPLGAGIPEGPALYAAMMEKLAASLAGCLGGR
ncbi:MAG: zinc ABC transporter substrate-binding protein [Rhodospirillales bacterium]|nr:zinc ABC transporter substrate-binding protein [Rhodospirillales bacterium]